MQSNLLILLMHVIKSHAEKRINSSWQGSIKHSLKAINKLNKELFDFENELEELFEDAVYYSSLEIYGGKDELEVYELIDKELVILNCLMLINL